ncbi:amino acid adenylation domain-containing protein [Pyxidicoccus sp. QH1ED-7-1]|nr:non-ribosomal peptide synthetase [Pyxidicoccus xibeiensis]MCP3144587.1 amino acid adenylation domain-containing protein [Pyxidicoccus xibeiensis]
MPEALADVSLDLASHLEAHPEQSLADVAFTLAVGSRASEYRRVLVARDRAELARRLLEPFTPTQVKDLEAARHRRVAFVFPGQGVQQPGMARELYEAEPAFRAHVDASLALLEEPLRARVHTLLHADATPTPDIAGLLADTRVALPALFTVEHALARTWMDWGVKPYAVLGHGFGEYAAACIAGVLSLADALRLATVRGELMHRMPPGAMLSVALPEARVLPLLTGRLSLASINEPHRCVIAGPVDAVDRLQEELKRQNVGAMRMPTPHALQSEDVEPLLPELERLVATLRRGEPVPRYASSVTGTWARPGQLAEPRYWADQLRGPVRFAQAVSALLEEGCDVLLEAGPAQDLTLMLRGCLGEAKERVKALASLRRGGATSRHAGLMESLGELWASGLEPDWRAFHAHEQRKHLRLPTQAPQEERSRVDAPELDAEPELSEPTAQAGGSSGPVREDAPRGDVEQRVAALWRERLGLEFVARDDNFLELGGNSLMAAQLLTQLRDTFGVQLPLAALFEAPTVAGIAERLEPLLKEAPSARPQVRELPLVPLPRTGELPLSFVQERVWRLEQHLPGLSAYTIPFVLRLEGVVDADTLQRCVQEVVNRHEALRTTYDVVDDRPVQRFHAHMPVPLTRVELTGPADQRETEAMNIARAESARPFDLVKGPVLRTTLIQLAPQHHILVGGIHHVVSDTLSIAIFINELGQLYPAFRQGRPSPLPPLPLQYADFGAWQRRTIAEHLLPDQEQWWRQRLAGMPRKLDMPTDRPRPERCPLTSVRMMVDFPPALAREVGAFGKREGFTSYMTVLAAWQALLHRYSGQTEVVVGTPIANRTRAELQPLIGYVAHSVAFRTSFAGDPTFRELIGRVKHEVSEAQARPDVPFEFLVEELIPGKDIGRDRMTDTVFVYHSNVGTGAAAPEPTGVRWSLVEVPNAPVQWGATLSELTLVLSEDSGRIHGAMEYATDLYDEPTARRIVEHLQVMLAAALARPDERISRLPLVTEAERRAWPLPRPRPTTPAVPTLLAERALQSPEAVATTQGGQAWTWAQLSARARSVAARLGALGVRPGDPVAVCLLPSPSKLAVLWGVLEAGGAVVALGPTDLGALGTYAPEGATAPVLVTWRGVTSPARLDAARTVYVEELLEAASAPATSVGATASGALAWLLPAGGNTPAWTLDHAALTKLFEAMDGRLRPSAGGTWLAAVEAVADRPEVESLWALSRGLRVTFPSEQVAAQLVRLNGGGPRSQALDLSLLYFANDEDTLTGPKYELLLEGSKFADAHGFSAVWTPERHFHSFGGLYPQPAVVAAGVATVTRNLRLRSGSVVLPLHDPLLIAEQWSVVDNLSNGRVGLSVATGWHVQDFAFNPGSYEDRRNILLRHLETLRALWRGEKVRRLAGGGVTVEVGLRPKPVQKELPVWLTATSNPETFRMAGELGAGVLTGLLAHSLEELKPKVALYREAWRRNGHPGRGHITCMVHTFIGDDEQEVLRTVRKPLLSYFRGSADIIASLLSAQGYKGEIDKLSEDDINAMLEHSFENYALATGLIGTVESGLKRMRDMREADIDEAACLIDFGVDVPVVLESLKRLAALRERMEAEASVQREQVRAEGELGVGGLLELARQSGAVLLHTSARLARTLAELPQARESLGPVGALVLEGASPELATVLNRVAGVEVLLAGGAAEGALLPRTPEERVPAGLQAWVLDMAGLPVPAGVVGELAFEGPGVPWGLWRAAEEERRRLVPHPLEGSARLYRSGRHARLRADGRVEPVKLPAADKAPALPAPKPRVDVPRPATAAAPQGPPAIPRAPRDQPLPLSFAQQRHWYLQQMEPSSTAYNNPSNLRLVGALDPKALQAALDELVRRHEVLRTTYTLSDSGAAVQLIHPGGSLPMPVEEVPGATPEEREAHMVRRCQEHAALPFDLEKGPVVRALLLRLGEDEHVLSLILHHAVSDAWCNMILARELTLFYACFGAGQPSPLPPLPVQYADYALWQRKYLEGAVLEEQLRWWKDQLTGVPVLELPTDRPRPAVQSYAGDLLALQWPRELSEPLLALGRREGATSFMVMMALYQLLLSRYSGQEDFAIGTPIAGRTRPEVEGLIGCFLNTLAFRSRLGGAPTFRELLGRVKQQALGAYTRQDAPFERLMELLQVPRDLSRTPVFQVILNVLNTPEADTSPAPLKIGQVDVSAGTAKFDLGLEVWERREGMIVRFEYSTSLFDRATVERMAEHLVVLARAVVASPDLPISLLPLLTEDERRQALVEWNATASDYPREATIQALFEQQATLRPEATALEFGEQRLTYSQLDTRANQLAHLLRSHGVGPDALVAVCLERSVELIVSLLAILKAGGAYLPLDASYPARRLAFMLEDAPPRLLITSRELRPRLPVTEDVPCLFVHELPLQVLPRTRPMSGATSRHLAYVDFTSGSTGRPKGVAVEHRGVMRLLHGARYAHLGPEETFLLIAPVSFDASTLELWGPLLFGGRLVIFPPQSPSDVELLSSVLQRHGVTTLHLTSGLFSQVVDLKPDSLRGVRQLLTGGDVVSAPHVRKVVEGMFIPVTACYGPTESTLFTSTYRMTEAAQVGASIPIGTPIANTQVYVLDGHGQPVPPGIPGELYIGGDGLARGYLSRPDLTAERFIPNPFSATPGERLYRTGDTARWRRDGVLEFLGRADAQVKIRGYRIELAEVEAALLMHPEVREAVVLAREDVPGTKRLAGYVVAPASLDTTALRTFLQERLPEYMVPSALVRLDALPLTANAKVDRKALPAPEAVRTTATEGFVAPRNATEEALAALWTQVLRVPRVGIHDNFFQLGGDSIMSLQLIARARQAGLHFTPRQLFQHQTIATLAREVSTHQGVTAEQTPIVGPVPLTPIQLAFLEGGSPEPHHFNQALMLSLREPVEPSVLGTALRKLVEHHDALRLRFVQENGVWSQHNAGPEHAPSLRHVDVSSLAPAERARRVEAVATELHSTFRLGEPLLLRAALFDFGPGAPARLLLVAHHFVVDTVSWRVLVEDLESICRQLQRGGPPVLPPKTTSFKAWAEKLLAYARSEELARELPYWLDEARTLSRPLPRDRAGGENSVASARTLSTQLNADETRLLLREVPAAYRARLQDVLLTALGQALAAWSGHPGFLVDSEGHGREDLFPDVDLSRTVGWFTAVHPMLLQVTPGASPGDALRSIRDGLKTLPGNGLGYGLLRYLRQDEASARLRAQPSAEVSFNYLGQVDTAASDASLFTLASESSGPPLSPRALREHLLDVTAVIHGGQLQVGLTYSENLHTEATARTLAESFMDSLRGLIAGRASPDALRYTPADFPLARLDAAALERVLPTGLPVEDVYPLSQLQQGMLFHSLLAPGSGVYVTQQAWTFGAGIDLAAFRRAWETVLERHEPLRTSFAWEGLEEPVQVVSPRAVLPWEELDWRGLSVAEQQARFDALMDSDRVRGFDLHKAPLMRLTVMKLDGGEHRVLWSSHHLLLDGWSVGLLFKELFAAYDAAARGQQPALGAVPTFRSFIAWLRQQSEERAEAYWRQALRGFTSPTPLPGELPPRADRPSSRKDMRAFQVGTATTQALQAFARQHQLTLNTVLQGAWALVLARQVGEDDVLFGATVSGRSADLPGIEQMVGLFINTLPMRSRVEPGTPVLTWLAALHAEMLELRQYEHTSLARVQGWSEVPRGTPLFESLYVFENYPVDEAVRSGGNVLPIRDLTTAEQPDVPLVALSAPGERVELRLMYDAARFDPSAMERLLRHWNMALESMLARPDALLASVSLLSEEEREQVLRRWNGTDVAYSREASVHQLFSAQAARTPDAIAVESEQGTLTYLQLDERSNQLANHLRTLGVTPGMRVALCLERGLALPVGLLGILKAGAAFVPLDPSYPAERLDSMLARTAASVLVTQQSLADVLRGQVSARVRLDSEWEQVARQPVSAPHAFVSADSLAYVMFTSGSTGEPKGVAIPHRGITRLVMSGTFIHFGPEETFLQLAPVSFDASTLEIWGALLHGARLVLFPPHAPSLEELGAALVRHRVTTLWLTAALFEQMAVHQPETLASVRQVLAGGDALPAQRVREHLSRLAPGAVLVNGYGPTENTTFTTCHRMEAGASFRASVPIGRPISNTRVYVLDAQLKLVAPGVSGELYTGGDGLAWGYLGRPDLTAERFVPNPFGTGERLYRTGDKVRWREDGTLEFLGRVDFQVKVRGFRIEPGEVESVLRLHSRVQEAVVVVREDAPGDKRLVAYAVASDTDAADLKDFLRQKLPEYMVPSALVCLESLPLTPNGKMDRKALPPPDSAAGTAATWVAPRTPTEQVLAGLMARVLRVERVGAEDNFFALGGHSLLATQLVSQVRSELGVELPLRALFEAPTVAALATRIDSAQGATPRSVAPPITPVPRTGPLPLSFAQQRLWFIDRLTPGGAQYNMPAFVRLEGPLDLSALKRALDEVVQRHEALRTTFTRHGDQPVQLIAPGVALQLERVDLSRLDAQDAPEELERRLREELVLPFNLATGPLLRALLLKLGPADHVLALNMHHIVSDGWSMGVLVRELAALYEAFSQDRPSPLPPLPIQYADYAVWQRQWLQGTVLEEQLDWWRQYLSGLATLELPTDRPRPPVQTFHGARVPVALSLATSGRLNALCQQEGATPFMALLAAFQLLMSRYSGQQDIAIGSPIAGRQRRETEGLIGFFVNTLVLRARVDDGASFRHLLRQVKESALGAYTHQDVPFERLVEELRPTRDPSRGPLVQVLFALQNAPMPELRTHQLALRPVELTSPTVKFELELDLTDSPEGYLGSLSYNTDLFERTTALRMAEHFLSLVERVVSQPDAPLAAASLPTPGER